MDGKFYGMYMNHYPTKNNDWSQWKDKNKAAYKEHGYQRTHDNRKSNKYGNQDKSLTLS